MKTIHIRIHEAFYQKLREYAEQNFTTMSAVLKQSAARTIGYKSASVELPTPVEPPRQLTLQEEIDRLIAESPTPVEPSRQAFAIDDELERVLTRGDDEIERVLASDEYTEEFKARIRKYLSDTDEDDYDEAFKEDLRRRAANAPVKPINL